MNELYFPRHFLSHWMMYILENIILEEKMIRKLHIRRFLIRTVGLIGILGFLIKRQKNRIKKSTKITLQEKFELGITDDKLKIIISEIDLDFANNQEKIIASVNKINETINSWKKYINIEDIEIIGILPEAKQGKYSQMGTLLFVEKLSSVLKVKYKFIEKQFYYDVEPNINDVSLEEKIQKELKEEIGLSCVIYISKTGEIYFKEKFYNLL